MVNAHSTQTAGLAGGFLRAKTEKLKKVLRSILTEYPAGVYNQDTPMGYYPLCAVGKHLPGGKEMQKKAGF